jgi:putative hemolysin
MTDGADILMVFAVIAALIVVNGFFAAAEMAFVSLSPSDIDKLSSESTRRARALKKVSADSTRYLSTIQVAITFAGFLSSAFAGSKLAGNVTAFFASLSITVPEGVSVVLVTVVLSYVTLVFGELVPKRLAIGNARSYALMSAPVVHAVMVVMRPFVSVLSWSTNLVIKLFKGHRHDSTESLSERDIREMIVRGHAHGLYGAHEKAMLESVFRYDDLKAKDIMTPRPDMTAVMETDTPERIIEVITGSAFSRVPVLRGDKDHVTGILFAKDILGAVASGSFDTAKLIGLMKKPFFTYEHVRINALFKQMKKKQQHMAVVVDEHGGVEGIVTMEDIIEEVFGSIDDEHDISDKSLKKISDNTYLVDGKMTITELNNRLGLSIDEDKTSYRTVAGLMIDRLGTLPDPESDSVIREGMCAFSVHTIKGRRITKVRLEIEKDRQDADTSQHGE